MTQKDEALKMAIEALEDCHENDGIYYPTAIKTCKAALSKPETVTLLDGLDFTPDEHHQVADMANVGYSLMEYLKIYAPKFCWNETPAEIVSKLANELEEAKAVTLPDGWVAVPVEVLTKIKDLPRFTFLSPAEGGVRKFLDKSGNWIERYEVIKLIDDYIQAAPTLNEKG